MRANGLEFNVRITGSGVPFVWSHGLTGSMAGDDSVPWIRWYELTDVIRLMRYDARGHGDSEPTYLPEDYHWANLGRDMLALADQAGFLAFVAAGGSMGCATAIYAALEVPERVSGLVLATPPTIWEARTASAANYAKMADILESRGTAFMAAMMEAQPAAGPAWQREAYPSMMADYIARFRTFDARAYAAIFRGAGSTDLPPRDELKRLHMPALILAWADDPGHPVSSAQEIAALLPKVRLLVAHNADDVAGWTAEIRAFVAGLG